MAIYDVESIGKFSVPQYQKGSERLWAMAWDDLESAYTSVIYSDNYGMDWIEWTALDVDKYPVSSIAAMSRDTAGNCYYSDDKLLYRVDAVTKLTTTAITFFPTTFTWQFFNWFSAEDNDGYLYAAAYTLDPTIPTSPGDGGHFIYVSPPGGESFTRVDYLFDNYPTNRHVHSIHVNPYNNKVYIAIGDATLGTIKNFVSDDRLVTITEISGLPQITGITATSEGTYFSSDAPTLSNDLSVSTNDTTGAQVFAIPQPYTDSAIYYAAAAGDNEIWMTAVDDVGTGDTGIICIKKADGVGSTWSVAKIIDDYEPETEQLNYYAIAHDGQSIIPVNSPYVFVLLRDWGGSPDWGLLRIQRKELPDTKYITTDIDGVPTLVYSAYSGKVFSQDGVIYYRGVSDGDAVGVSAIGLAAY